MFDITLERPRGDGDAELVEFENAQKLVNVPELDKAVVTDEAGESEKVPCASIVSVVPTDESPDSDAN